MVHGSTLAGSVVLHQMMLSVHFSTQAGSRAIHQLSHQSTFLHLLGPELYTSFLTGPLFYTCWVHDSTLGFNFIFWSILLHQLGPESYTRSLTRAVFTGEISHVRCFKTLPKYLTHGDYSFTRAFYIQMVRIPSVMRPKLYSC